MRSFTRREFIKISSLGAGMTASVAFLGACAAGSASDASSAAPALTTATTAAPGDKGHIANGAPRYQNAMNKAKKVDATPSEAEALAKFVVVSDTHLSLSYKPYLDRVQNMFEDIAQFAPDNDAIIVNGDITDAGDKEQYAKFAELAKASGFRYPEDFVLVIGNHDQTESTENGQTATNLTDLFREQAGIADQTHPYYDCTINGVHIIVLGPDSFPKGRWIHFGISDEEVTWMDGLIDADLDNGRLSFVFLHEPLYKTVRQTDPGDFGHEWSLSEEDNYNLHDCLRKHPNVIFFSGHTHAYPDTVQLEGDEPLYVGTGSVAYCIDDVTDDFEGAGDMSTYGSYGWEVTVWETCVRFRLRDFLNRKYVDADTVIYQF